MKLTRDQRVLLKREADMIREAYESNEAETAHSRAALKERYEEIDRMLRCEGENGSQTLMQRH